THGAATHAGRAQLVEVSAATAPGDLEAGLDEALADRAAGLEVRDEPLRLLLDALGDVDLGDHLLRVFLVVEHAMGDDLDCEWHGTGRGHLEPDLERLRAVRADRGDFIQAIGLGIAQHAHAADYCE